METKLKRLTAVIAVVIMLLLAVAVAAVSAQEEAPVVIETPPLAEGTATFLSLTGGGGTGPALIYDLYDWNSVLTFSWDSVVSGLVDAENLSYRVSIRQYPMPFTSLSAPYTELQVAHHWEANPNGTRFTMGPFGFGEEVCFDCVNVIIVQPETFESVFNPATGQYEYEYTPVGPPIFSDPFQFVQTPRYPVPTPEPEPTEEPDNNPPPCQGGDCPA